MPPPINHLLATLWQKHLPQVLARIDLLDRAATDLTLHAEAHATAHKLAGSLGMYGYQSATEAARLYEQELETSTPDPATLTGQAKKIRTALTNPS